ncbi:Calmodulin protein 3, partial [Globisporangium splendens]
MHQASETQRLLIERAKLERDEQIQKGWNSVRDYCVICCQCRSFLRRWLAARRLRILQEAERVKFVRDQAAISIQEVIRGFLGRRKAKAAKAAATLLHKKCVHSATTIQRVVRGYWSRKSMVAHRKKREVAVYSMIVQLQILELASLRIQCIVRGFLGRRRSKNRAIYLAKLKILRERSALKIQRSYRAHMARVQLGWKRDAGVIIALNMQAFYRGYIGRLRFRIMLAESMQTWYMRDASARSIQHFFRSIVYALQDDSTTVPPMHLWFKTALREDGKAAISNIKYAASSRETDLFAKRFTHLKQDINRNGLFGKHKYIWVSHAPSNVQTMSEIIDLALTCGDLSDKNDARLWLPPHRGFELVPGNLNEKSVKAGVFLWVRRRRLISAHDLVDPHIDQALTSPRSKSSLRLHIDGLEEHVRKMLRRNCPLDQDGALNFGRLFDGFDTKKTRRISKQVALVGIESFGIKMVKKRSMTTRSGYSAPNYRLIFQSYNSLNDGKLSRSDFQRIFATNQLNFTNSELSKVMQRFDVNKDGVVDYTNFLRYVTGICDASPCIAGRIFDAAEEIRAWATEKQNKKMAKDGNIDSTAAWKCLKLKHGLLETASLDHILRQRNARLDSEKLQLLKVLMALATNGEVNQAAFHAFVNHFPKKIATMVYDLKKVIGPVPQENKPDVIFDRLNVEDNGKLSLVSFVKQMNALAMEKNASVTDLKDFVYFLEGVQLLRDEIKKCAKTLDGKFNFLIPFRQFDKDSSGGIMLSEFEAAIREFGVDKYLSDQEIKSLVRRFDPNSSGAIDYDEFLRFNLAESTSSSRKLCISPAMDPAVHHILEDIVIHERLSSASAVAFCSSLKRMFGTIDKETTGFVPNERFVQTLRDMGITVPKAEMDILVHAFAGEGNDNAGEVHYLHFCDLLLEVCAQEDDGSLSRSGGPPATELLDLLMKLHNEFQDVKRKTQQAGYADFDFYRAFGIDKYIKQSLFISAEEFKEVLWAAESANVNVPPSLALSPALAERIYRCFLNAAQKNISGRKLLEKCDATKTGAVTLLEFQTVLCLMGCTLREGEVDEIKKVLGNDKNSQISYIALVQQISKLQQQMQKAAATVVDRGDRYRPSPTGDKAPSKPTPPPLSHMPSHAPAVVKFPPSRSEPVTRTMMVREDMVRADSFLRPFFADLLHTRSISREAVLQHFEAYDGKSSGFVSTDAFHAVTRKLDIWLPADVSSMVSTRFTSFSGNKFDYIDFCQVVTPQTLDAEIASQARHRASASTPSSSSSAAPKLPQPSMQPATQDPPKVPDGRESVAAPIFHREQFAPDHPAKFEQFETRAATGICFRHNYDKEQQRRHIFDNWTMDVSVFRCMRRILPVPNNTHLADQVHRPQHEHLQSRFRSCSSHQRYRTM